MAVTLHAGKNQFFASDGSPLASGKLYTYVSGTSTPKAAYTDDAGTIAHANPIVLDSRGEAEIYWTGVYDVTLKTSADVTIWGPIKLEEPESDGTAAALDTALRAELANTSTADEGDTLIGVGSIVSLISGAKARHASLHDAVTAIGSNRCAVVVSRDVTMSASATFPSTATLRIENGARITTTGYELTARVDCPAAQCFSGTGTVKLRNTDSVLPQWFGASSAASNADNKTALQAAIAASAALGSGVVFVGPEINYGYDVDSRATWPSFSGITNPVLVIDRSQGSSYSGYPAAYDGAQERIFTHTPQTTATLTFTASLSGGATSATLTANWGSTTGPWLVTFSNGDARAVTLTNGSAAATWSGGLSGSATSSATYTNSGQHDGNAKWLRSSWAPALIVSNDMDLTGTRTITDNRRANIFFAVNGIATWRLGQGTIDSNTATDEALSNFGLEKFSVSGDTLGAYTPFVIQRSTGNWSFGGGTNAPPANYHFKSVTAGYEVGMFESLAATASVTLRNSSGSSDDVRISNSSGDIALNIPALGDAVVIKKSTRNVLIGAGSDDAAVLLNMASTTKGFLPPKMTTTQRDAISSPPSGLVIFNTTTNKLNVRGASAWEAVTST